MSETSRALPRRRDVAGAGGPVTVGRVALLVSLIGLAAAGYLTYEHYTAATTLACPDTGAINCVKVTTSSYSRVLGIPVAVLGVGFFAVMTFLCLPTVWGASGPGVAWLRLALSGAGLLFVLYLVWVELFRVNAICLWCTAVHALTLLLFATLAVGRALRPPDDTTAA